MRTFTPWVPEAREYSELSPKLAKQLALIEPSHSPYMDYFPCSVLLKSGELIDGVYVSEAQPYLDNWTVWPDQDSAKLEVSVENIAEIQPSQNRIPVHLANRLYQAGESGMGYLIFTARFNDGSSKAFIVGGVVDFINAPPGLCATDIVEVEPHVGRNNVNENDMVTIHWCIHGKAVPKNA